MILLLPEELQLLVVASELEVVSEHSNKHLQSITDIVLNKSMYCYYVLSSELIVLLLFFSRKDAK